MGNLAIQRKDGQSFYITVGEVVCKIKVYNCEVDRCKIAINAPPEARIEREEVRYCDDRR